MGYNIKKCKCVGYGWICPKCGKRLFSQSIKQVRQMASAHKDSVACRRATKKGGR